MGGRLLLGALAALSLAAAAARAADTPKCRLIKAAEFPVTMRGMKPLVPVKINGQDVLVMADSGAFYSTLTPEAAKRLGLQSGHTPFGFAIRGAGGEVSAKVGVAGQMVLSGIPLKKVEFVVAEGAAGGQDDVGLLGQNVLGFADVEYDLANGVIRLMVPKGDCRRMMPVYWRKPGQDVGVVDIQPTEPAAPHLRGRATLNGQSVGVMFDTGASSSMVKRSVAERTGFRRDADGVEDSGPQGGIGRRRAETWVAPFAEFQIGGETIKNTRIRVSDLDLLNSDMLIGADFFLAHRIYVASKQHKLYFTYNGGPVFRLDRDPSQVQAGAEPVKAPDSTLNASNEPADAAGYARRGSAFAARRDFPHAIADFTRAVELEPTNSRHYVDRATARLGNRQPILAMADFEQALKLKPGDECALLGRGALYLESREVDRAAADFEAAAKAASPNSDVRLALGTIYTVHGRFDRAITQYDAWIAANPNDGHLPIALNGRCWARTLSGKQLDAALADCEAAIKRGGRLADFLDSRGLVKLRLGRYDEAIADYDASLKLQPKNGWSLYGRGLAKLRRGLTAEGEADMQAGLALRPSLREEAQRAGLEGNASAAPASAS